VKESWARRSQKNAEIQKTAGVSCCRIHQHVSNKHAEEVRPVLDQKRHKKHQSQTSVGLLVSWFGQANGEKAFIR
jgi:hypothetical protein